MDAGGRAEAKVLRGQIFSSAQWTTFGTLKPNLSMHVPPGADAPKTSMPTKASAHLAPVASTQVH